jgi:hypothetical protein
MSTLKPVHWLFLTMLLGGPVTAENGQTNETFSLPDAVVLFGAYNELRVTAPGGTLSITPPMDASGKEHPFSFPSISPDGALVAASFAVTFDESQPRYAFRNALGIYSLRLRTWNTFGQFDAVGRPDWVGR